MAMLSWFFNLDGTVNAEHKEYLVGNVLSLFTGKNSLSPFLVMTTSKALRMPGLSGMMSRTVSLSIITMLLGTKPIFPVLVYHISIITAVALSKLEHNMDDNLKVYLALPPAEVSRFKSLPASHNCKCRAHSQSGYQERCYLQYGRFYQTCQDSYRS